MNTQLEHVYNYIMEHTMIQAKDRIVVGLSGGADSVCLLHMLVSLCAPLKIETSDIVAVHIHHGLRGEEADRDARFAKELCERLGVSFELFQTDIKNYAKEHKYTVEEAGRIYRYACFEDVCARYKCNKIAVAHNKNDLAETVLFHIVRGSGIGGLRGIVPVRDNVIRPLLDLDRESICKYLDSVGETYCEDSTNASVDYDRNRIRHEVLPVLKSMNDGALSHICALAKEADEYYTFSERVTDEIHDEIVSKNDGKYIIFVDKLKGQDITLQKKICFRAITSMAGKSKDVTSKHVMSVLALLDAQSGKEIALPYGLGARKNYETIVIENSTSKSEGKEVCISQEIQIPGVYRFGEMGTLTVELIHREEISEITKNKYTKMLDYGKINGKLFLRTQQDGDILLIDAEGNSKKLTRLFIDQKIDRSKRATWPIVADDVNVVWAIGLRENYAYRIDADTRQVLVMQYEGKGEEYGRED